VDYQVRPVGSLTLLARPSHQDRTDSLKAGLCTPGAAPVPNVHLHVFKRPAPFFQTPRSICSNAPLHLFKRPIPFVQTPRSICSNAPLHLFKRQTPFFQTPHSITPRSIVSNAPLQCVERSSL
jgi:hypothetical protein